MSLSPGTETRRTPLYHTHLALGAKMTPFAGFEMPVQYSGIIDEHLAVRNSVGIFDVSHMGEVIVSGPDAFAFVQNLVSNDVSKLVSGKALYTVMCAHEGGIVDDLLVYKLGDNRYMLVINAANIATDFRWMKDNNPMGAKLENISDEVALIAVQGPNSFDVVRKITTLDVDSVGFYKFVELPAGSFFSCSRAILSHTGYTGEKGMEIYCDADHVQEIWDAVIKAGAEFNIKPAGLGARDTLRLESGFCLYGNDLNLETNPLEAGLGWLTKLNAGEFIGRDALVTIKESGVGRRLIGFVGTERGIPRSGSEIQTEDGQVIGLVTSGTQSPILKTGIGMGYVTNQPEYTATETPIRIASRGRSFSAVVKKPPFHK